MAEVEKTEGLKQTRTRERAKATKLTSKLRTLYQDPEADPDEVAYSIHQCEKQIAVLEKKN